MKNRLLILTFVFVIVVSNSISLRSAEGAPKSDPGSELQTVQLNFEFVNTWTPIFKDSETITIFDLSNPYGIAVSPTGDVYVTDSGNNRVVKFSSEAVYINEWGGSGTGDGQFDTPEGIAIDQDGYVYVVDWNDRVQKFTADGAFVLQWGGPGDGEGEFGGARGVTVDADGYVYVADTGNNRIQKFTSDGSFITQWGEYGQETSQFQFPTDVAVDADGNVYVSDRYNARVQKFTSAGVFVTTWGDMGSSEGEFILPTGITVSASGSVYVVAQSTGHIQRFSLSGDFELLWGSNGSGNGEFNGPTGIATTADGLVYVVDSDNDRIQLFTEDGDFLKIWVAADTLIPTSRTYYDTHARPWYMTTGEGALLKKWIYDGAFLTETIASPQEDHPRAIVGILNDHDDHVNIAIQDNSDRCLQNFSAEGVFLSEWCGGQFASDNEFWAIRAIDKDESGNVYLADTQVWTPYNHQGLPMQTYIYFRIQKFDPNGNLVLNFGPKRDEKSITPLLQNSPTAIALDSAGEFIYFAVAYLNQIFKYNTSTGELLDTWGDPEQSPGEFNKPQGISVDPDGNVYVADTGNQRIRKLASDGQLIAEWGAGGAGEGEFDKPSGITIVNDAYVFVADSGNNRVQVFDLEGQFLAAWGSQGTAEGEFSAPGGVAADAEGHVYVMDNGNLRIQKFLMTAGPVEMNIFLPLIVR